MRARYVGYTRGTMNHGDEALMCIIRDILGPEIEVVFEGDSFEIALLGGGTLINQSPWLIDEFQACLDKSKTGIVFGTGVGDLTFWGNHFDRWIPLLKRCSAVGVRGPDSLSLLKEHHFEDAVMCGDPYLWLTSSVKRSAEPNLLGVNIGSTNNAVWGSSDKEIFAVVEKALTLLRDEGWQFHFFSVWDKDLPLIKELHRNLGLEAESRVLDVRTNTDEAYALLARCQVFLGEKLHGNAMAAIAGVPFVALEYQPKVRDFAASINMGEWVMPTKGLTGESIVDAIRELARQEPSVSDAMTMYVEERRKDIKLFAQQVKSAVLREQ